MPRSACLTRRNRSADRGSTRDALPVSTSIAVGFLADHLDLVSLVARWHQLAWGEGYERSETAWQEVVTSRTGRQTIPLTLVAHVDARPVGCLSVSWDDVDLDFADEGPWLAGVYVYGPARNLGVGRALVGQAENLCAALGHRMLWAHTAEAHRFYERCGWHLVRPKSSIDRDAVLRRDLS